MEFPEGFRKRYEELLGAEAPAFFEACDRPLRKSLKVNPLKVSIADFETRAKANGWELTPIPWLASGYWIDRENREIPLGKSVEHYGGWFYLQEASSMIPAEALMGASGQILRSAQNDEGRGGIVLDLAAAPGGKSLQIAAALGEAGLVISNDVVMDRVQALVANLERAGALNIGVTMYNGNRFGNLLPNTFDRVLLDAPCTGEGTVRKDRLALERWSPRAIEKMTHLQAPLAASAFKALKPGGTLVYSTCTLSPEENEGIVDSLLKRFPGNAEVAGWSLPGLRTAAGFSSLPEFRVPDSESLPRCARVWPQLNDTEGFFVAKIVKREETPVGPEERRAADRDRYEAGRRLEGVKVFSTHERRAVLEPIEEVYGIPAVAFEDCELALAGQSLWLWKPAFLGWSHRLKFNRCGLRLFSTYKATSRHGRTRTTTDEEDAPVRGGGGSNRKAPFNAKLSTWAAQLFGRFATRNVVHLDAEQTEKYLLGSDLPLGATGAVSVVIVCGRGVYLGTGLLKDGVLKNQLPRHSILT